MYSPDSFSQDEGTFSAGTDLIISLVALLTVLLAANQIELQNYKNKAKKEETKFEKIQELQMEIIEGFAKKYNAKSFLIDIDNEQWGISASDSSEKQVYDIIFYNEVTTQRIVFGTNVLFDRNDAFLKKNGQFYIKSVSEILQSKKEQILEIRILGHADNTALGEDKNYNLNLASQRAISVYSYMRDEGGIQPTEQIISATTYAEFMPVSRKYDDRGYDSTRLESDNLSDEQKAKNRRIEIVLHFYED